MCVREREGRVNVTQRETGQSVCMREREKRERVSVYGAGDLVQDPAHAHDAKTLQGAEAPVSSSSVSDALLRTAILSLTLHTQFVTWQLLTSLSPADRASSFLLFLAK